jgi:hypothetical protein
MKGITKIYGFLTVFLSVMFIIAIVSPVDAHYYGGESTCSTCCPTGSEDTDSNNSVCIAEPVKSFISLTEGNMGDSVPIVTLQSAFGSTIDFTLTYNSYLADGSQGSLITVLGKGWTHSYNIFLFEQSGNMFKMSATGRTTKYKKNRTELTHLTKVISRNL